MNIEIGIIAVVILVALFLVRVPIAYALLFSAIAGMTFFYGVPSAINAVGAAMHSVIANFEFTAIPFFVMMGYFAFYAGFTTSAYESARLWLNRVPGGLASASVVACAIFAACSGSGTPAAAAFGRIAVPEMVKYGYNKGLSAGVIAAGAPLAVLIPPSNLLIILAIFTNQSIGQLLMAGLLPGILAVVVFAIGISVRAKLRPVDFPPVNFEVTWAQRFRGLRDIWGMGVLFLIVIISIYAGVATPTEAASIGGFGAFVLALIGRKMTWPKYIKALMDTVQTSGFIFLIIVGATAFSNLLTRTGVTQSLTTWMVGLQVPTWTILFFIIILYAFLGMFLESVGMIVLTMPVIYPVLVALGVNVIWFGILVIIFVEIGCLTPPVGITVFVVKGAVGDMMSLGEIFRGSSFYLALWVIVLIILLFVPQISLWLPSMMVK